VVSIGLAYSIPRCGYSSGEKALQTSGGNILAAAQLLGIGKTTTYRKVKRYGITTRGRDYGRVCPPQTAPTNLAKE
jgi:DNA-binding NtrC family response regulator